MMQAVLPNNFRVRMLSGFSKVAWNNQKEIYYIGGSDVLPEPLTTEEETEILQQLLEEDNQQARGKLDRKSVV